MIIDWPFWEEEGYHRLPDARDPASWNEPVWRLAAYATRFEGADEGWFEPISEHNMTVAEIRAATPDLPQRRTKLDRMSS